MDFGVSTEQKNKHMKRSIIPAFFLVMKAARYFIVGTIIIFSSTHLSGQILQQVQVMYKPKNSNREIPVQAVLHNDKFIIQGDIVIGDTSKYQLKQGIYKHKLPSRMARVMDDPDYKWKNNKVPYFIPVATSPSLRDSIMRAIQIIEDNTNVDFVVKTNGYADYVAIIEDNSIAGAGLAEIGRIGGKQHVWLKSNVSPGVIVHEFLHTLGFLHEHTRSDRDEWINIDWSNISPDQKYNFYIDPSRWYEIFPDVVNIGEYDCSSIMHYSQFAFAIDRSRPVITCKQCGICPNSSFGNLSGLSYWDIYGINYVYPAFQREDIDFVYGKGWNVTSHPRMCGDINGDGKDDIVAFGAENVFYLLSNGSGFNSSVKSSLRDFCNYQGWQPARHTRTLGDVNGDGKKDIVGFGTDDVVVSLFGNSDFTAPYKASGHFAWNDGYNPEKHVRLLGDVNGDGRDDIVAFGTDDVFVSYSEGRLFSSPVRVRSDFAYNDGWRTGKHERMLADVNGDGKADIVAFGTDDVFVLLSTGTGFANPVKAHKDFCYNDGWTKDKTHRILADVNGDGRDDIIGFGKTDILVALSNGSTFGKAQKAYAKDFCYANNWRTGRHVRLAGDYTGDGEADLVLFGTDEVFLVTH